MKNTGKLTNSYVIDKLRTMSTDDISKLLWEYIKTEKITMKQFQDIMSWILEV